MSEQNTKIQWKYKDGNKVSRTRDSAPPRRFRPLGKPPKPEINLRVLEEWIKRCRGQPSKHPRGFDTRAERDAEKQRIAYLKWGA